MSENEEVDKQSTAGTLTGTPSLTVWFEGLWSVDDDFGKKFKFVYESDTDEKAASSDEVDTIRPTAPETHYVTGVPLILVFVGMMSSMFLVTLDNTVLATAIPKIASQFNALEQVTWLATAYFLTQCGLMLMYGQLLARLTTKWVYLATLVIFEVGSLICGAAPNINILIFGRAFAGVGAGGLYASTLAIIAVCTPLDKRPLFFGTFGAVFALSSVVGPLMGGAFSDHLSWRWCFYINLPIGVITIISIIFCIKPEHSAVPPTDWRTSLKRLRKIDWIGSIFCLAMVTTLLLAMQWGGVTRRWDDKSVIACFVVFGVSLFLFLAWEVYMGNDAVLPLALFKSRTQVACCIESFFLNAVMVCCTYYLPLYYQSAEEHSATRSGIDILLFMGSIIIGGAAGAGTTAITGLPRPWLLFPPLLPVIAAGVVFWDLAKRPTASSGILMGMQYTMIMVQAEFAKQPHLIPQSTTLVNFTQLIGGVLGIAISGTIFGNELRKSIAIYAPDLDRATADAVRQSVEVIGTLSGAEKAGVIRAYSSALGYVFIIAIPSGILASASALLLPNYNIKKMKLDTTAGAGVV
ncbi:hypothetical protein FRB99_006265 [Tulasnella sp. 403]|nr:hypothetical protein FRB99_006265 [Tulasnella sp. 403]